MEAEVICMECGKVLGTKNVEVPEGFPAQTHGICAPCDDMVRERDGLKKRRR